MINLFGGSINESGKQIKKEQPARGKGMEIELLGTSKKYVQTQNNQDNEVDLISLAMMKTHVNKQGFKMENQTAKLIKLYSGTGSTQGLTREEFKNLAKDLYATVDKDRKLTQQELDNLVNLLDTDKNQMISRSEIRDIVEDKPPIQNKNAQ